MTAKLKLREEMRARRAALGNAHVASASAAIAARLAVLPAFVNADWVLAYVSQGHEVDTHGLIRQLLVRGRHVCVPRYDETRREYGAAEIREFATDLVPGKFGLLEPPPGSVRPVPLGQLGAVLVPGVAFARAGDRLGRGRGFFDRLLAEITGPKIALAFDFQVVLSVPMHAHDVRMDYIVTETELIVCGETGT